MQICHAVANRIDHIVRLPPEFGLNGVNPEIVGNGLAAGAFLADGLLGFDPERGQLMRPALGQFLQRGQRQIPEKRTAVIRARPVTVTASFPNPFVSKQIDQPPPDMIPDICAAKLVLISDRDVAQQRAT